MKPTVTVIIATYNYSNVLKYALQSVLWQTFQDFEVWVIGDACTDDSEAVVASFGDARIHWHNLPENSGSQSTPNNVGIQRAQGKYIAYLGHDDLWYPTHLQYLVEAMERDEADVGHTLLMMMRTEIPYRMIYGITPSGQYEAFTQTPPSSVMHRRDIVEQIGWWKDYRTMRVPPDIEFVARAALSGKKFVSVQQLTVFKFPAAMRRNSYRERPSHEQAAYAFRIQNEPDLLYREMLALVSEPYYAQRAFHVKFTPQLHVKPGEIVAGYREIRGLDAQPSIESSAQDDLISLMAQNPIDDITPDQDRKFFYDHHMFPVNGVLLTDGWYGVEKDGSGYVFRWVNTGAQFLVTNSDGKPKLLSIDVRAGYANEGSPITVSLVAADGDVVGEVIFESQQTISFEFTPPPVEAALYTLQVSNSLNLPLPTDPRILNFAVSKIRLSAAPPVNINQREV